MQIFLASMVEVATNYYWELISTCGAPNIPTANKLGSTVWRMLGVQAIFKISLP